MAKRSVLLVTSSAAPYYGGGAADYYRTLVTTLPDYGWEVSEFVVGRSTLRNAPRLRERQSPLHPGVRRFELVNSPLDLMHAPESAQSVAASEFVDSVFRQVAKRVRPSAVHLHDCHSYPFSLVDAAGALNLPTVITVHNYYWFCPRRDLYSSTGGRPDLDVCQSCSRCGEPLNADPLPARIAGTLYGLGLASLLPGVRRAARVRPKSEGIASESEDLVSPPTAMCTASRASGSRALERADMVHCYSRGSRELVERFAPAARTVYLPISSRIIDSLASSRTRRIGVPLRFQYRGGLAPHKGLEVLVDAFVGLSGDWSLDIYGEGGAEFSAHLRDKAAIDQRIRLLGPYGSKDLAGIVGTADVGCVPSSWPEVFGLVGPEYINAGVPVIGSAIGGIPDYVHAPDWLFPPGDIAALRSIVARLVDNPNLVREARASLQRWPTVQSHVSELETIYDGLGSRGGGARSE